MPSIRQANSLFLDFGVPNWKLIDSTWANLVGTYEISATETSTPLLTGTLDKTTPGTMKLRLLSSNSSWTALAVGSYKLMIEFNNTTVGYREEKQYSLLIKTQGM